MSVDLTALLLPTGNIAVLLDDNWFFQFWQPDVNASGVTSNFIPGLVVHSNIPNTTLCGETWPMVWATNVGTRACAFCHRSNHPSGLIFEFNPAAGHAVPVNATSTSQTFGGSTYAVPLDTASSLLCDKPSNPRPSGRSLAGDLDMVRNWTW